jgi:hypothetical protein
LHAGVREGGVKVYLQGIGLWGAGLFGWEASLPILRGESPLDPQSRPVPPSDLLAAAERRRAPSTVRLALRVAQDACTQAQAQASELASVFASSQGDTEITDYMCRELALPDAAISPTKFHNSVHNAASGYWTIATGCTRPSNAISGYSASFACGLLEAASLCVADQQSSLLCAYDIAAPQLMVTVCPVTAGFGVALVLSPSRAPHSIAELNLSLTAPPGSETELPESLQILRTVNPIARALPLLVTLALRQSSVIDFTLTERQSLRVEVASWK